MTDETTDPIAADDPSPVEATFEQPKRRGRPPKPREPKSVNPDTLNTDAVFAETETKTRRTRRTSKLTGKDVEQLFDKGSQFVALTTGLPFWYIPAREVEGFSGEFAELLNRIPSKYVKAFTDMSGYLTVAFGMYAVMVPRIQLTQAVRAQQKEAARREAESPGDAFVQQNPGAWGENYAQD